MNQHIGSTNTMMPAMSMNMRVRIDSLLATTSIRTWAFCRKV